jgi:hypothetical protein
MIDRFCDFWVHCTNHFSNNRVGNPFCDRVIKRTLRVTLRVSFVREGCRGNKQN